MPVVVEYGGRFAEFDPTSLHFHTTSSTTPVKSRRTAPPGAAIAAEAAEAHIAQIATSRRQLERLVLNVANYCNLDCVYCYAQGGDYGGPQQRMSRLHGEQALTRFLTDYDEIGAVQFFGGEPLLNLPLVEHLCRFGWRTADELGRPRPVFTMSSNGTVLNDAVVNLVNTFDIKLTVSVDGPPDLMDTLRPSRSGAPAGRRVERNIRALREMTGQPVQIEGTYTATHLRRGIAPRDVLDYVHDAFGVCMLHMPVNALPSTTPMRDDPHAVLAEDMPEVDRLYADVTADAVTHLLHRAPGEVAYLSAAVDVVEELVRPRVREHPVICPAGSGTIAVDVDGTVYPCFMFYRQPGFALGHVGAGKHVSTISSDRQLRFLGGLSRRTPSSRLEGSWARRFLAGCAGANYFRNGNHGHVSETDVELVEHMVAAAVVEVAHAVQYEPNRVGYLPIGIDLLRAYVNAPGIG